MTPESLYFLPSPELKEEMFDLKSDSNKHAREVIGSFERVLSRGTTENISLGSEFPYFTLGTDPSGGFLMLVGIHYLERRTREVDGQTKEVEEVGGGTVVLDYSRAEKREEFIKAKDEQGGIERVEIKVVGDPETPSNIYKFDSRGRSVLRVEIVSWETKRDFSVPLPTNRKDIYG
jgi:hypothetical protein